jgi:hypothetical protein
MFALTDDELGKKILGCGDGPASFNAEATRRGSNVISCDPIYRFDVDQIRERIAATYEVVLAQTRRNEHEFVWSVIRSVDELGHTRMAAMNDFLRDYAEGKAQGRYVDAELPAIPYADMSFDIAICSHLLFLYTAQLGEEFHRSAIRELCRLAPDVRVFPLLALGGAPSPFVNSIVAELPEHGFDVSIEEVRYEFQRGGNKMMRITRRRV